MSISENVYKELIKYIAINPPKTILEVGREGTILPKLLKQEFNDIEVSFLTLNSSKESMQEEYQNSYSLDEFKTLSVDVIIIMDELNLLEHNEGYQLINSFLPYCKDYLLCLTNNDSLNQGYWQIVDFKDYDVTFFNLYLETEMKTIYKLYPNDVAADSLYEWSEEIEGKVKPLKITYVLPHKNLTGGLKMLYEQMKSLQKRGHKIQIILKGSDSSAKADWVADFIPDEDTVIGLNEKYLDYIEGADLIFAGFFNQLDELENDKIPVMYWEQGSEYLYGDMKDVRVEEQVQLLLKQQFSKNIYLASDSKYVSDVLKAKFNKASYVLPNFIDTDFYYPLLNKKNDEILTILLVGNPYLAFKGFQKSLYVLLVLYEQGVPFKVAWACQVKPSVSPLPFEITFYENLPQNELANLYRECDILLTSSLYEGCPMPPLEAMASGVAVVTTDCGGVKQYATHLENALISSTRSVQELAVYVKAIIENKELREQLIQNGLKTAQSLNYKNGGAILEKISTSIVYDFQKTHKLKDKKNKKIKVLFMIGTLLGGGAEKVLTNIVKYIDKSQFDVTVQTVFDQGIYIDEVKKYVNYKTIFKTVAYSQEELENLNKRYEYLNSLSSEAFSREVIEEEYDVEVAFLEDQATKIIAYSPNKKAKKIAWVHLDLYADNNAVNLFDNFEEQYNCYLKFDEIICVSKSAKEGFIKLFNINDNVSVIYNPVDTEDVLNKAKETIMDIPENDKFKIISIGRLLPQKGYDRLILAHQQLIKEGFDFELWIIGEGHQKEQLEGYIMENDLADTVKLLGFKTNPYKYLKCGDLFVCSSRYEGFSLVVAEAIVLGLPIITTNCSGPNELIDYGKYGLLVDNDTQGIYLGLKMMLTDTIKYNYYKKRAKNRAIMFNIKEQVLIIEKLLLQ